MAEVYFGTGAYKRENGRLPEIRLVNMFAEAAKTAKRQVAIIDRPGLATVATWGTGPVRGVFQRDGLGNGDRFAVIGNKLYREGAEIGTINGTGVVKFAASRVELVVCAGQDAFSYLITDTTSFAKIELPDDFECLSVIFIATLFVFVRRALVSGTLSHRFYWSAPNDARTVDDLDFASAESSPDPLLDIAVVGDNIVLLGSNTIETWMVGGSLELPFTRISQRLFQKGIFGTGACSEHDNTLFFVGVDNTVYRMADVPQRISDHGLEERISQSETCTTFPFSWQGHQFFAIRLDQGTWLYDAATGEICEFATLTRDNWRAQCATMVGSEPLFGDDTEGKLLEFSGHTDTIADLERLFTVAVPLEGTTPIDNLVIDASIGWTPELSGEGREPIIEARMSRDKGNTWTVWRPCSMGRMGQYRKEARWNRWGYGDAPGVLWEVRTTDPGPMGVSRAAVNESGGGRAR